MVVTLALPVAVILPTAEAAEVVMPGGVGSVGFQPEPVTVILKVPDPPALIVTVVEPATKAFGLPETTQPPVVAVPVSPGEPRAAVKVPATVTVGVLVAPSYKFTGEPVMVPVPFVIVPSRIVECVPAKKLPPPEATLYLIAR